MKALVTGFDAFGGDKVNPSSLAVRRLASAGPRREPASTEPTEILTTVAI